MSDDARYLIDRREAEQRRYHARRPKKISDVLAQLITARGYGRVRAVAELQSAWQTAAGEQLGRSSRAGRLSRGRLEVFVGNSTILQELGFHKARLLAELNEALPDAKIRELRFRIAAID